MQVTVKLYASFRWKLSGEAVRQCQPGARVVDIVRELEISVHEVGIVLLNGIHAALEDTLNEGDVVSLMPLMGGG